jgi:hypothetical protein
MKLTHLANQKIVIARLTPVASSINRQIALTTVTAALGHLQPLARDGSQLATGVTGKNYVIYLDGGTDIQENDQLKDESGNIYTVRSSGVTRWRHGAMDYLEVYLTQK